eukprot:20044-Amphidinium_carterae.1
MINSAPSTHSLDIASHCQSQPTCRAGSFKLRPHPQPLAAPDMKGRPHTASSQIPARPWISPAISHTFPTP